MNDRKWIVELILGVVFVPICGFIVNQYYQVKTDLEEIKAVIASVTTDDGTKIRRNEDYFKLQTQIEVIKIDTGMIKEDLKELSALVKSKINSI